MKTGLCVASDDAAGGLEVGNLRQAKPDTAGGCDIDIVRYGVEADEHERGKQIRDQPFAGMQQRMHLPGRRHIVFGHTNLSGDAGGCLAWDRKKERTSF